MRFNNKRGTMLNAITYMGSINKKYTFYTLISIFVTVLFLYVPVYLSAYIVDEIVLLASSNSNEEVSVKKIISLMLFTVGIIFLLNLIGRISERQKEIYSIRFYLDEKKMFSKKAMNMKFECTEKRYTNLLKARIDAENQTGYNMSMLYEGAVSLIRGGIGVVVSLVFVLNLLRINQVAILWKIVLVALLALVVAINTFCNAKKNNLDNEMMEKWAPLNQWSDFYTEYLNDYKTGKDIRMFEMKDLILGNITTMKEKYLFFAKRANVHQTKYVVIKAVFLIFLKIIIYSYVVIACLYGGVTIGEIAAYVAYTIFCVNDAMLIISSIQSLLNNIPYLKRYFDYLTIEEEKPGVSGSKFETVLQDCKIEFCDVSFHYPDSNEFILRNINIEINTNEKIAIVGRNGSGKTTFIKLLCRLYEPTSGTIFFNGKNIQEYDYNEYISKISIVFQDFQLYSLPICENIAGSKEFNLGKVIECLKQVEQETGLSDRLDRYIYKYISDDGIDLSGGEAQKVAIARALYKNGAIMILDEPTSAMDAASEEKVFKNFHEIAEKKNVIFISHRLSACQICDRILVFDNQDIVQSGTHEELLSETDGIYNKMWQAQTKNYVID